MKKQLYLSILCLLALSANSQVNTGGFHANFGTDADTKSGYTKYGPAVSIITGDDWFSLSANRGKGVIDTTGASYYKSQLQSNRNLTFTQRMSAPLFSANNGKLWLDAFYSRDHITLTSTRDTTSFSAASIGGNPRQWTGATRSIVANQDIVDAYAHLRRDGSALKDSLWLFTAMSTLGTSGDRYLDAELYKKNLSYNKQSRRFTTDGLNAGHTEWILDPLGNVVQTGDLLVSIRHEAGDAAPQVEIRIWISRITRLTTPNPRFFRWGTNFEGGSATALYGYINITPRPTNQRIGAAILNTSNNVNRDTTYSTPWGTRSAQGWSANYQSKQLIEVGVNLTRIGLDPSAYIGANLQSCDRMFQSILFRSGRINSFGNNNGATSLGGIITGLGLSGNSGVINNNLGGCNHDEDCPHIAGCNHIHTSGACTDDSDNACDHEDDCTHSESCDHGHPINPNGRGNGGGCNDGGDDDDDDNNGNNDDDDDNNNNDDDDDNNNNDDDDDNNNNDDDDDSGSSTPAIILEDFVGPISFTSPTLTYTINTDTLSCEKNIATLQILNPSRTALFKWSTLDGGILEANADSTVIKVNKEGNYLMAATLFSGCPSIIAENVPVMLDNILPVVTADIGLTPAGEIQLLGGDTAKSKKTNRFGNSEGLVYNWTGPNGFTSNQLNPIIDAMWSYGAYHFEITELRNGCKAYSTVEVSFARNNQNGAIEEQQQNQKQYINLRQDRTSGKLFLVANQNEASSGRVVIHNLSGQLLGSKNIQLKSGYNNIELPAGASAQVRMVSVYLGNKLVMTRKVAF